MKLQKLCQNTYWTFTLFEISAILSLLMLFAVIWYKYSLEFL
jgi:hypothetical protein